VPCFSRKRYGNPLLPLNPKLGHTGANAKTDRTKGGEDEKFNEKAEMAIGQKSGHDVRTVRV